MRRGEHMESTRTDLPFNLPDQEAFRPREAAAAIRVSRPQIHRLLELKLLSAVRVGGAVLIPRASLEAYLRANVRPWTSPSERTAS